MGFIPESSGVGIDHDVTELGQLEIGSDGDLVHEKGTVDCVFVGELRHALFSFDQKHLDCSVCPFSVCY